MRFRIPGWMLMGALLAVHGAAQEVDEYQLKAVFLYNFAKFVEWPPQAFQNGQAPLALCVLGRNPFGSTLGQVIRGKSIEGRELVYRPVSGAADANNCQILFVPSSESKRYRSFAAALTARGILTVGEVDGFAADGGVINFKLEGGRVRFEINIDAADREQLHISSKLLSLAEIVKPEKSR